MLLAALAVPAPSATGVEQSVSDALLDGVATRLSRLSPGMTDDPTQASVVVFGGHSFTNARPLDELWVRRP